MSFPLSPTNNQQATVNGITYSYSTTTGAWTRVSSTAILVNTGSLLVSGTWTFALSSTGSVTLNGSPFVSGSGTSASATGTTTTFVISNTTVSTGTNSGALTVTGGVGIGGGLYVGGVITATNVYINGYAVNTGTSGGGSFTGGTVSGATQFTDATSSTNSTTGAVTVIGGVGIRGNLNVGGTVTGGGVRTTTTSTNPSNPVVGDLWYNTSNDVIYRYTYDGVNYYWIDINGPDNDNGFFGVLAGTDITVDSSIIISSNSTLQSVTGRGSSTTAAISIINATQTNATNSGALIVAGGVGVGGGLYVGGNLYAVGTITATNATASTSTTTGALTVAGGVGVGGSLAVGGTTILQQAQEVMVPVVNPGASATLNFNSGAIFYITGMTSNFTATFINVPTAANYVCATSLILAQTGTAYVANAVSINGTLNTIRWSGGSTATVTANRTDVISITIMATGTNAYTVLASGGEYY